MNAVRFRNFWALTTAVFTAEIAGRVRAILLPAVHLIAFALVAWIVFGNNRSLLLAAYDGNMIRTITRQQFEWGTAFPGSTAGPLEGMANTFFPINPRYCPSYLVARAVSGSNYDPRTVYWVIGLELFVATWLAGRAFRLPAGVAVSGAWVAPVLILPMCFVHGTALCMVNYLSPQVAEFSAGAVVAVVLLAGAGRGSATGTAARGVALYALITLLTIAGPAGVVLWAPPTALLFAFQVCASETRREAVRKLALLVGVGAGLALTAVPFVAGTLLYTVPTFFAAELQNDRINLYMVSSLFHSPKEHRVWAGRPFIALALVGALAAGFASARPTRALGRFLFLTVAGLIGLGLYVTFRSQSYRGPSPLYFEYVVWPYCALAAAYAVYALGRGIGRAVGRFRRCDGPPVPIDERPRTVARAASVAGIALAGTGLVLVSAADRGRSTFHPYPYPPTDTPVVAAVTRELALAPGRPFRGSVAAFHGSKKDPGTTWADQHVADSVQLAGHGTEYRATGFWYYSVPTLWEYSPLITPAAYLSTTRMLADPADRQLRSVTVLTRPHAAYLQSVGVRFVVTNLTLPPPFVPRETDPVANNAPAVALYELPDANLGGYSPTELVVCPDARAAVARLAEPGFDFRRTAVVADPVAGPLVPGTGRVRFERGGVVVVEGSSPGRSVLLLPVQYTRCWQMKVRSNTGGAAPELIRMNVAQTGLVFSGAVEVELEFVHGPFANPWGRVRDYLDFRAACPK